MLRKKFPKSFKQLLELKCMAIEEKQFYLCGGGRMEMQAQENKNFPFLASALAFAFAFTFALRKFTRVFPCV